MFPELKQKVVLVIGSSQGIGKAVVDTFLANQAIVIAADIIYTASPLEITENPQYYQVKLDISREVEIAELNQQLIEKQLIPDILVDVAGISTMDFLVESQTSDFDKTFQVNTRGAYLALKYFTKTMIDHQKQGRV
ncbi:MAG: SDR family oxidoreductase, partial [Enterococcus sp.]